MTDSFRDHLQASLGTSCTLDRELGGGGMSRVFVATESALGRQIVVKVLPPETGSSVSAERFKREIQVAAKLQHPHIVPLLTAGESDGLPYYTMPFVKGESLRARLTKRGELSVNDTMHVLRDIASALAYAHSEGVVHRDIKPDNVMLSGGVAVVTDFGVAKALDVALTDGGHSGSALTSLGVALGTPAYMAPEQAAADPHADHRADLYSFGCLAYEMLAGSSPFAGRPLQQLLSAQVTEIPEPVERRRPNMPPPLAALVMKCLEKRPGDRPQSADELITALDAIATPSGGMAPTMARPAAVHGGRRWTYVAVAAMALILVVVGVLAWRRRPPPTLHAGATTMVAATPDIEMDPGISPDGKLVAYVAETPTGFKIFVRQVSGGRANPLSADVPGNHEAPHWSPDGSQIAFSTDVGEIYVVPALGGNPKRMVSGGARGPAWSPSGAEIAYTFEGGIGIQPVAGGAPRRVVKPLATVSHSPAWSPDGRYLAFAVGNVPTFTNLSANTVMVVRTTGGDPVRISDSTHVNVSPVWTPDGRSVLYVSNRDGARDVYQQPVSNGRPTGVPTRLTTGLGPYGISLSADGSRLAFDAVRYQSNIWTAPIPPVGTVDFASATQLTRENERVEVLNLSHDGKWLAYDADRAGNFDIYKIRVEGGEPIRLTTDPGNDFNPTWSPDDRQIAFHSQRTGVRHIYVTSADGTGDELIASGPGQDFVPNWSPDGKRIVFYSLTPAGASLFTTERGADGHWSVPKQLTMVTSGPGALAQDWLTGPRWSPDGASVAYAADGGLAVMSANGGPAQMVADVAKLGGSVRGLVWTGSPATLYVGVLPDGNGRPRICLVPLSGGPIRVLLANDATHTLGRLDFATDGKRIFFTLAVRESDVGVLELKK